MRVPASCTVLATAIVMTLGLACARSGERSSLAGATRVFRCDDGYQFVARFEPERVWLFLGQRTHSLPQIPSTSGIHYTDGRFTFRERDDQAWTEGPGESHARCVNQPVAVPWEEARLKGVDFRAVGQDSAWTLEIDEGSGITFEGGGARSTFPPVHSEPTTAVTQSSAGDRTIRIEQTSTECIDRATGERLDVLVRVTIDGREHRGCGRRLRR